MSPKTADEWVMIAEGALVRGFLALAGAVAAAVRASANGYELSINTATPAPFRVGTAAALAADARVGRVHANDELKLYSAASSGTSPTNV